MSLSPKELIHKLTSYEGPCMRLCAYCPEDYNTRDVKECVEKLIRVNYALKQTNDEVIDERLHFRQLEEERMEPG